MYNGVKFLVSQKTKAKTKTKTKTPTQMLGKKKKEEMFIPALENYFVNHLNFLKKGFFNN